MNYFDYKTQAEEAIVQIRPALLAIGDVVGELTSDFRAATEKLNATKSSPREVRIAVILEAAKMLSDHSRDINAKCPALEHASNTYAAAITNWLVCRNQTKGHAPAPAEFIKVLRLFVGQLQRSAQLTASNLKHFEHPPGRSAEYDVAVNEYVGCLKRVRNAINQVVDASLTALQLLGANL